MTKSYKEGDVLSGFKVTNISSVPEHDGILYEFLHEESGMRAFWLKTDDNNKLFSIAFKTTPEDDTGVFHILEHSVLCGSEKYPVREPFLDLMKSSMQTFLNAMTSPDKTLYPVSSRNNQDLINLAGIYLDAVFAPKIYENPNIFYQEGWHYDITDENETPEYQGVVLNEMRGAEDSLDSLMMKEIMRMLYPDNCYGYVAGGCSESIPTLTYEHFIEMHRKYYNPSNAILYLEGDMNPEIFFEMTNEYASGNGRKEPATISMQGPAEYEEKSCKYPLDEDEPEENRCHMIMAKVVANWNEKAKIYAIELISNYLADSIEAPLKQAILEAELGQDVRVWLQSDTTQPSFVVWICNTEEDKYSQISNIIDDTINGLIENKIDKDALEAALNQMEFQYSEISEPKNLTHNMMVLNSVLYGGEPLLYLNNKETFEILREKLHTDYYEKLLEELFDKAGQKRLFMSPDKGLKGEQNAAEKQKLINEKAGWSSDELARIINQNKELLKWQESEDTKEQLATMPKLSITDIAKLPEKIDIEVTEVDGVKVLKHHCASENVVYLNMYFAIEEEDVSKLSILTYLPNLIGNMPTTKRGVAELNQDIQKNIGSIEFSITTSAPKGDLKHCGLYFVVRCSVLRSKIAEAKRIIQELLLETDFTQEMSLHMMLLQCLDGVREDLVANGQNYALYLSGSGFSAENTVVEAIEGISSYRSIQDICQNFDTKKSDWINLFSKAQRETFCKERLTLSVTAKEYETVPVKGLVALFPQGSRKADMLTIEPIDMKEKYLPIPANVSYAALSTNLYSMGYEYSGKWNVVSKILSLRSLWNLIRVQNGAYGAGMFTSTNGNLTCHSYRDPNPDNSLKCFYKLADYIREFCESDESLDDYIISSIAEQEPVLSPQAKSEWSDMDYFSNMSYEKRCEIRKEILALTKEDLLECADILDDIERKSSSCIAGPAK